MRHRITRSPYVWAAIAAMTVVAVAWVGRERYQPVTTGSLAPDFVFGDLAGEAHSLAQYRGEKVVLLNIWATWCAPCREELPSMQRLYDSVDRDGFEILAVSIDARLGETDSLGRPGGDLEAFADEMDLTFPILQNPRGDIQRTYQTTGVPETFLVGKDGIIYKKVAGETRWDAPENRELVRRLVRQ